MTEQNSMVRLGDVLTLQRGFDLPKKNRKAGDVPLVSSSGISDFQAESKIEPPAVITGRYGTLGKVFYLEEPCFPLNTTLWVKDFKGNLPKFCKYLLETIDYYSCSDKAAVPGVNRNHLEELLVREVSKQDQKAIADILGTLDEKIELNQKMNQTLEEIAKTIFKSWFVDFDPVRAKAEGRPTGLPPEISDLFPDELVDSEIGDIPKGWSISCIGEHADVIDCLHSKKPTLLDEGFNFLQLKQIGNDGLLYCDGMSKISQVDYEKWTSRIEVAEGDCIVTNVGRVGAYARIPRNFKGAIGRNITGIRPHADSQMDFFIADYLSSPAYEREKDLKTDTGTILDALNVKNIPKLRFIFSAPSLIECHREISRSLWQRRELLVEENQVLSELRDTLLPKLISGELRIPDAEKFLEETGI